MLVGAIFGVLAALGTARLLSRYNLARHFLPTAGIAGIDDHLYGYHRNFHHRGLTSESAT
jgi:hypothetical protein